MDLDYLLFLQGVREVMPAIITQLLVVVSAIIASPALIILPCIFYWCVDKRAGQFVVFSLAISGLVNQLVKNVVCCYRPWIRSAAIHPHAEAVGEATGYSFPSGHTQTAGAIVGSIGYYFRKSHRWAFILCWVLVALVAFSRNYLGVHTPQDVLVALVESVLVILLVEPFMSWAEGREGRDAIVVAAVLAIGVAFLVFVTLKPYPMDYDASGALLVDPKAMQIDCYTTAGVFMGGFLGWFLERRFVGFSIESGTGWKFFARRLLIGIVITAAFHLIPNVLTSVGVGPEWLKFVKFFATVIAATFVAPAAFVAVERRWKARLRYDAHSRQTKGAMPK